MSIRGAYLVLALALATPGSGCENRGSELEYVRERLENGEYETGALKDGMRHGEWVTTRDGAVIEVSRWKDGRRHGVSQRWQYGYSDVMWHEGEMHGRFRIFSEEGRLTDLLWVYRGMNAGIWCSWFEDGELYQVFSYGRPSIRMKREDLLHLGHCPPTTAEPRHFDPDDRDYTLPWETRHWRRWYREGVSPPPDGRRGTRTGR